MSTECESAGRGDGRLSAFLQPTSTGLLVLAVVLAVVVTVVTALFWDRGGWWITLRFLGPLASFGSLAVATLIAVNMVATLFSGWTDVWSFLL